MFLEYYFVVEAFSSAQQNGFMDLLPLIGYTAGTLGANEIVQSCTKMFSSL
jgi:hypothetical protein